MNMTVDTCEEALRVFDARDCDDSDLTAAARQYCDLLRRQAEVLHRSSRSGKNVNEFISDGIDRFVRKLYGRAEQDAYPVRKGVRDSLTLLAVGGYARREMAFYSDVDLMFLYPSRVTAFAEKIAERVQYWLWDGGLQIGAATRNAEETLKLLRADETIRTSVLAPRYLAGDADLFHEFSDKIRKVVRTDAERYLRSCLSQVQERHSKFEESLYLLQPNLKEGAGGLRDYHAAYWASRIANPSMRGLDSMLHFGLLTERELEEYASALDFIWCLRNELHLASGRKNDQMSFELQEKIASQSKPDQEELRPELAVEKLMGDYYRHARAIRNYSALIIEQCHMRVRRKPPKRQLRDVEEGFQLVSGRLEIPHAAHLRDRPERMLLAFVVAQDHDVELSRTAQRLLRENLDVIDERLRNSDSAADVFLRILRNSNRVARTLAMMNELRVLESYLPEWAHIFCRWQHVIYHTYTVDIHSIFLVEQLRRLQKGEYRDSIPDLTLLMQSLEDPTVLYLGALYHDIGKGLGGNHSIKGAEIASKCVGRLGLSSKNCERVVFLVAQHLRMTHLAQRRDLTDPKVIVEFARLVGDRENLRLLYLLSFADMRASSPSAWTHWKWQLLKELFERCSEFLEAGADDPRRAIEQLEARVEVRQKSARAELLALGVAAKQIDEYFSLMPRRYFLSHTPRQIVRHARVMIELTPDRIMATSVRNMRGDFSELIVATRDVTALYAKVAGVLTAKGVNILGSHVYTMRSGQALEVYRVSTPSGGKAEQREIWKGVEAMLNAVLSGMAQVEDFMRKRRRPVGEPKRIHSRRPPTIRISNSESDFYTICDVSTNDRLGLLYDLTSVIAKHGFEVYISKASTVLDQVADTFYLKDVAGAKIRDEAALAALREDLLVAAASEYILTGSGEGEVLRTK